MVSMYKYLGVVLTLTLRWTQHAQHLVQRGNRLFAQCVSLCRSERLPLAMASSILMVYVLPSASWSTEFFSHSPPTLRQLDRRWGRFLLGWPSGSPSAGVLAELGWSDAERLSTGRLLSLSSCMCISQWPDVSAPWNRLSHCCRSRRKLAYHAQELCLSVGAVMPHMCGVVPGYDQVWPDQIWPNPSWPDQVWPRPSLAKPSLAKTKFGQDQVWPDQVWPRPSLAKTKFGQDQVWPRPSLAKLVFSVTFQNIQIAP